jgi:hypothetical protein
MTSSLGDLTGKAEHFVCDSRRAFVKTVFNGGEGTGEGGPRKENMRLTSESQSMT